MVKLSCTMKRIYTLLAIAAIAAMAASCEKEINQPKTVDPEATVFTASSAQVKTTIENGTGTERIVKWAAGDEIKVWWSATGNVTAAAATAGTSTTFSAAVDAAENYYASYPSTAATAFNGTELTVAVPASQDGTFSSANIALATTTAADKNFVFHNATGVVKFAVADAAYTKAVFRGNKGETIAGNVPVAVTSTGVSLGSVSDPKTEVEVTVSGAGDYYFAILPVNLSEGFTVTLYKGSAADPVIYNSDSYDVQKSTLLNLGSIDDKALAALFVTPAGAGKKSGRNWDNAMGTAEFYAILQKPEVVKGITVHMAAGDYYLAGESRGLLTLAYSGAADPVDVTVLGGYPASLSGTVTTGRDASSNISAFTGNDEAGILALGEKAAVSFDGVTFKNAKLASANGAAVNIDNGATAIFNGCNFKDNEAAQGGAVAVVKGTATFEACTFDSNNAVFGDQAEVNSDTNGLRFDPGNAAGGAIVLQDAESVCTLNNCIVKNNTAANGNGGAIAILNKSCTLTIGAGTQFNANSSYGAGGAIFAWSGFAINGTSASKVTFDSNKTLATGNQVANGGAIWLNEGTTSTMSYAVFSGNEAGQPVSATSVNYSNGAISMKGVTSFKADNCEFTGNIGRNGGCFNLELGSASVCEFTNCNFHDNNLKDSNNKGNYSGAAARISYGTAKFTNCTFKDNSSYNRSGVFHLNSNKAARIECTGCTFEGNSVAAGNGGVATVEYGSFKAVNCTFKNNKVNTASSGTRYGGVFRCDDKDLNTLDLEGCTFEGNFANQGGVINVNAKNTTRINNCAFIGNKADSRGMIQMASSIVYINGSVFYNNTTTANGGWGVTIHGGANAFCMNNTTIVGNQNTSTTAGNDNCAVNVPKAMLITNSTVIESNQFSLLRLDGADKMVVDNNILVNTASGKGVFFVANASGTIVSRGHNAISSVLDAVRGNAETTKYAFVANATDKTDCSEATFGGSYSESAKAYVWNGSLTGFTAAAQSDVVATIKDNFAVSVSNPTISNVGQDFYNWLDGLSPKGYLTDGRGVTRSGSWWPGAYQN